MGPENRTRDIRSSRNTPTFLHDGTGDVDRPRDGEPHSGPHRASTAPWDVRRGRARQGGSQLKHIQLQHPPVVHAASRTPCAVAQNAQHRRHISSHSCFETLFSNGPTGMPMYLASAVFVRHTMHALYSDLRVVLNKVSVVAPPPSTTRHSREKTLSIGLSATGVARVSGAAGEWEVNSTYTFSPLTGLIHIHTINSIHPAPHQAVYDSLRTSLGTMFGAPQPSQTGKPTTCARKASGL
ncbi:unnamed protein product [Mycena citricolor]|uniref:Uncharacterized protein n=1 Tax=Mycena citricolor TaxID=2018698 RepID=A0AAD2GQX7_9AGAR|nr:unnamed protein product [Mycena citricolor]